MLAAVAIEAIADLQLDEFIATSGGGGGSMKGICSRGLWGESNLQNGLVRPLASHCTTPKKVAADTVL